LWIVAAAWLGACAPLNASTAIAGADEVLEAAKQSEAETLAPYSYWMAVAYLHKARLTEGYSEFGAAERFAIRAKDLAQESLKLAAEAAQRGKLRPSNHKGPGHKGPGQKPK
jgi:hypothetical protein